MTFDVIATVLEHLLLLYRRLAEPELHPGEVNGVYGPETQAAVSFVRSMVSLPPSPMLDDAAVGIIHSMATWARLQRGACFLPPRGLR